MSFLSILAAAATSPNAPSRGLFMRPLPIWGDNTWPWLLVPLCIGVAIVYKSIKCRSMKQVPKEAAVLTVWILAGMAAVAVVLAIAVDAMQKSYQ